MSWDWGVQCHLCLWHLWCLHPTLNSDSIPIASQSWIADTLRDTLSRYSEWIPWVLVGFEAPLNHGAYRLISRSTPRQKAMVLMKNHPSAMPFFFSSQLFAGLFPATDSISWLALVLPSLLNDSPIDLIIKNWWNRLSARFLQGAALALHISLYNSVPPCLCCLSSSHLLHHRLLTLDMHMGSPRAHAHLLRYTQSLFLSSEMTANLI